MTQAEMMPVDLKRTAKALRQTFRKQNRSDRIASVLERLPSLLVHCGEGSIHRRMVLKIACALVSDRPVIYAPACPDYSHNGTVYTFRGLEGGISLLTQKHIAFLEPIAKLFPEARIILLLADQEADDAEIRQAIKVDRTEFLQRLHQSLDAIRSRVTPLGWEARFMTEVIPDLVEQEAAFAESIAQDALVQNRLQSEMCSRISLYQRVRINMLRDEMLARTIRTASQYVALGSFVVTKNALVCNHTTTNLGWYNQTNAAVLHNPVSVY